MIKPSAVYQINQLPGLHPRFKKVTLQRLWQMARAGLLPVEDIRQPGKKRATYIIKGSALIRWLKQKKLL